MKLIEGYNNSLLITPLQTYVKECIQMGRNIDLSALIDSNKNSERALALCFKLLSSYKNIPRIINSNNCDLWWSVVVCGITDHNPGVVYGYSSKESQYVCDTLNKYLVWFLVYYGNELLQCHDDYKTIKALFSKGVYTKMGVVKLFKSAKEVKDISFLGRIEWVKLLIHITRRPPYVIETIVERKFTTLSKSRNTKRGKSLLDVKDRELVSC